MDARSITEALGGKWHGSYGSARCPAHHDTHPSLSISPGQKQPLLLNCHSGCAYDDIVAAIEALGIPAREDRPFSPPTFTLPEEPFPASTTTKSHIDAIYQYRDENNSDLFETVRYVPKNFKQRHRGEHGEWVWNLNGTRRVLYRLPELEAADPRQWVYIPEGEKDVERLRSLGLVATCNPMGAGKWADEYSECLRGRTVVLIQDNDEAGVGHVALVRASLAGIAAQVITLQLPNLPDKGDVSDWLDAGGTSEQLQALATEALAPRPFTSPIGVLLAREERPIDWIVQDLFSAGSQGFIGAEPKVGKSLTVIELMWSIASGTPFLDRFIVARPRRVLYIQEEDSEQRVLKRFKRFIRGRPERPAPSDDFLRYSIRAGFKLDNDDWLQRLRQEIASYKPDICLFDVFAKMHLQDENSQTAMAIILDTLDQLTREFGCAFILVHHFRKAGGVGTSSRGNQMMRGSGVLGGWAECSLYLKKRKERNTIEVTPESKDAEDLEPFMIVVEDQADVDGIRLYAASLPRTAKIEEQNEQILETVKTIESEHRDCTSDEVAQRLNIDRSTATRRLGRLVKDGSLTAERVQAGRARYMLYATVGE